MAGAISQLGALSALSTAGNLCSLILYPTIALIAGICLVTAGRAFQGMAWACCIVRADCVLRWQLTKKRV